MPRERYEVLKELGSGSEGVAYLLESCSTGELVVRKKFSRFEWEGALPREVVILTKKLGPHRNIVNLIDYRLEGDPKSRHKQILTTHSEYCAGGDLSRYQDGRTDEDLLWHVFMSVAAALAYMHYGLRSGSRTVSRPHTEFSVIHRDVKPDNIFLKERRTADNPFPDVVLGDFGCATLSEYPKKDGDRRYMAPEGSQSPESDVWALGSSIYYMACGRLPVDKMPDTWTKWLRTVDSKEGLRQLPRKYSDLLNEIVMACSVDEPRERVTSAKLLQTLRKNCPFRSVSREHD